MKFFDAVTSCFRQYVGFSGRARRSEFWYFSLFSTLVTGALTFLPQQLSIVLLIFQLLTLLPGAAVSWRRMHDIGKPGAWILLAFVPVVGTIIVLIWCCRDSEEGDNEYGPNPKTLSGARIE